MALRGNQVRKTSQGANLKEVDVRLRINGITVILEGLPVKSACQAATHHACASTFLVEFLLASEIFTQAAYEPCISFVGLVGDLNFVH